MSTFITVAIPYVNSTPHLGYAFELIEADLAATARRQRGEHVRFLGGTDDYSLKNVLAAEAVGEPTQAFVDRHADRFESLAEPLRISFDDFIRTSSDPRHQPAVERLWRACADSGDLYQRDYEGLYCVGCEQFYELSESHTGACPEHGTPLETVVETNWFFRLSRYGDQLLQLIESNELQIDPEPFRNEILAFLRGGVRDISVSRSVDRARGWGIPVPDDPTQVIYVWFDALTNYISALGYATHGADYERWWRNTDDRIHVVGKGIVRFHAVYWPAFLLSAGEPLPTRIHVHPYLTVDGSKLSKSSTNGLSPTDLVATHGSDALRWWIATDVAATTDTDFTHDRLVAKANEDLANGLGNAVNRVTTLRHRQHESVERPQSAPLDGSAELADRVTNALADFDRRAATRHLTDAIDQLNRHIEAAAPWKLARQPDQAEELAALLDTYIQTLQCIAEAIEPITPDLAHRINIALDLAPDTAPSPVYPRLDDDR
jgi:methionyl-tRNA synthetase